MPRSDICLEICVETPAAIAHCAAAGVDRIELCSALGLGGLTPGAGLMQAARQSGVESHAMIRPRAGDFIYDADEVAAMCADIDAARAAGMAGVVFGALTPKAQLDRPVLKTLVAHAGGLHCTLHRAIDLTVDPLSAVDVAVDLGFGRILTSGGQGDVRAGADMLGQMTGRAAGRIQIMAGGGVSVDVVELLRAKGIKAFHASCRDTTRAAPSPIGTASTDAYRIDPDRLSALQHALA